MEHDLHYVEAQLTDERRAVGIHVYSGAFSLGMSRHYTLAGQLEEGEWGAETFELNFPDVYHPLDRNEWDLDRFRSQVEVVFANPPCAPWSVIGSREGKNDPRFEYTVNSVEAGIIMEPDFFVLESVCRAWTSGQKYYLDLSERFRRLGYQTTFLLTNALLHGGCQWRERFHFIAHRWRLDLSEIERLEEPPLTVGEVIDDLAETATWYEDGVDPIFDCDPPNHCVRRPKPHELAVFERVTARDDYNQVVEELIAEGVEAKKGRLLMGRLHGACATRTIVDINCVVHHSQDRLITAREGLRLCGYPDTFTLAREPANREYGITPTDITQVVIPTMGDFLGGLCKRSRERGELIGPQARGDYELIDWRKKARHLSQGRWLKTLKQREERERERDRVRP